MSKMTMQDKLIKLQQPLTKDDIEIRVGQCGEKGASFLLYKTARVDMKRFNDIFGTQWKREHYIDNKGNYVCKVSIYDTEIKEWITREDVGTESNTEKEKGAYSDSFKRACSSFGSGIELYDAPFIFISGITKEKITKEKTPKKYELTDFYYAKYLVIQKYEYSQEKGMKVEIYHTKNKAVVFTNFSSNFTDKLDTPTKPTTPPTKLRTFKEIKADMEKANSVDELNKIKLEAKKLLEAKKITMTDEEKAILTETYTTQKNELNKA